MIYSDNKNFKDAVVNHFERTTKTGWGKKEVVKEIKDLWTRFLEQALESSKGGD